MGLPDAEKRWVPDAKVRDYCLSDATDKSRSRKEFFEMHGFSAAAWQELRAALHKHAETARVRPSRTDQWGTTYRAVGPLLCPDGRNPTVVTFWIVCADDPRPQLTSAVPG